MDDKSTHLEKTQHAWDNGAMKEVKLFSEEEILDITTCKRRTQLQRRRLADRWCLALCLPPLAACGWAVRSLLLHDGRLWQIAILLLLGLSLLWAALRATWALYVIHRIHQLRFQPAKAERYSMRLDSIVARRSSYYRFALSLSSRMREVLQQLQSRRSVPLRLAAATACLALIVGGMWLFLRQPTPKPQLMAYKSPSQPTVPTPHPTQSVAEVEPLIQTQTPTNANIKSTAGTNTTSEVPATTSESNLQQPTVSSQCDKIDCQDWCNNQEILAEVNYIIETSYSKV